MRISDDTSEGYDDGDQISNTLNVVDTLRKKTVINKQEPDDDVPVMDRNTDASSLRAMLKTKSRSAFDET